MNKDIADTMYSKACDKLKSSIENARPEENKVVAIIGGQPGAGKSSVTRMLENKYNNNIISLNGDDFKEYYPNYLKLLKIDPDKTSDIVQPYSNYVVDRLKEDMIAKGLNVMVEGTMRNPDTPVKTAKQFTQHGYKAEAHVISVNEYASQASCIERYERDVYMNGSGRSVKLESHDEAYSKIPATLEALSKSEQISNIMVYNRNGDVIADLSNEDNVAQKHVAHREQITPELVSSVEKSINNSIQLKELRNAPQQEITDLNQFKDKLHNKFHQTI